MELFDFLIIVLPLWNDTHCCLQLGLFGHWVITQINGFCSLL